MLYVFRHAATVEPIFPRLNLIRFDLVLMEIWEILPAIREVDISLASNALQVWNRLYLHVYNKKL